MCVRTEKISVIERKKKEGKKKVEGKKEQERSRLKRNYYPT
jgi:hypothetical protein